MTVVNQEHSTAAAKPNLGVETECHHEGFVELLVPGQAQDAVEESELRETAAEGKPDFASMLASAGSLLAEAERDCYYLAWEVD